MKRIKLTKEMKKEILKNSKIGCLELGKRIIIHDINDRDAGFVIEYNSKNELICFPFRLGVLEDEN